MSTAYEQTILQKLRHLPPERLAEVEAFVDFLAHRQAKERGLIQAAGYLATAAFARVWDNPADADYEWFDSPSRLRTNPPSIDPLRTISLAPALLTCT